MSYRDHRRLEDIEAAIRAIHDHLGRGDLSDGMVFYAVRMRVLEIGETVKALPPELLAQEPGIPWRLVARCATTWRTATSTPAMGLCRLP